MTDLHYEVTGSGPAVCLVHSGVTDSRMWDRQVAALAPYCSVLRYDIRAWRQQPRFGELLGACRELCDEFEAHDHTLASAPGSA